MSTIQLSHEAVGLAFQQKMRAMLAVEPRSKRKVLLMQLRRNLINLNLIPDDLKVDSLTMGIDSNGRGTIVLVGATKSEGPPYGLR